MVRKLLVSFVLAIFISNCFAGFAKGGRSGFSGRSYSSVARSGYSPATRVAPRTYTAPNTYSRSYSGTSSNTVIHNNHYSSGGYGMGGGFLSGMLGGYIGGSLASAHNPVVMATGATAFPQGQGMLMEPGYIQPQYGIIRAFMGLVLACFTILLLIWASVIIYCKVFDDRRYRW